MFRIRAFQRIRVRAVLATAAAVGLGTMITLAQFTDTGSVTGTFSTGSVDISFDAGQEQGNPTPYQLVSLNLDDAGLGDSVVAPLTVNNSGTLPFTYTMQTTADPDAALSAALQVTVAVNATSCDNADGLQGGTTLVDAVTGLANVSLAGRPLDAGTNETLCFEVTLPDIPDNNDPDLMGQSTTATFAFTATQS